jgi:hypothetical protein
MSLLRRVERAQQAAELAQREAASGTSSRPLVPVMTPPVQSDIAAPTTLVPVLGAVSRNPARDDLLREIRMRLQGEVISAFDTLLDVKATDVHQKIEAIVDTAFGRPVWDTYR